MRQSKVIKTLEEIKKDKGDQAHKAALKAQDEAQKDYSSRKFLNKDAAI